MILRRVNFCQFAAITTAVLCLNVAVLMPLQAVASESESRNLSTPAARAEKTYRQCRDRYLANPADAQAAWHFARACFDWAEFSKNSQHREKLALEGIEVSRKLISSEPQMAAARYYLAMNLGQLARTKTLGALKLVDEMEREFKTVLKLDAEFDFAGPDRNLGLLYLEAPVFGSIGNRKKGLEHIRKAVDIAPVYPENRLILIEALLKTGDKRAARDELVQLDKIWERAERELPGEFWETILQDWSERRKAILSSLATKVSTKDF